MFRPLFWLFAFAAVASAQLQPEVFPEIETAIRLAIAEGRLPGAVVWVERGGEHYEKAIGERAVEPEREAMTVDTIFDAASLTKVVATTPCVMKLIEQGKVELGGAGRAVSAGVCGAEEGARDRAAPAHAYLGHQAGHRDERWITTYEEGIARACANPLGDAPGTLIRYSDINFILLGEIVRRVSGKPLDEFAAAEIFEPLGMKDTGFRPATSARASRRPRATTARGVVHDPTARKMGGVAGHAGLFTTAGDLARFARMLLARRRTGGRAHFAKRDGEADDQRADARRNHGAARPRLGYRHRPQRTARKVVSARQLRTHGLDGRFAVDRSVFAVVRDPSFAIAITRRKRATCSPLRQRRDARGGERARV